ncbi:MAG TPA: lantibiotic dehydratase, partial [Polyangia bacterium]
MAIRLVSSVLVRAPLLRLSDLERPQAALLQHPLGAAAVALASRDLGAALGARKANQASKAESDALHRYGRRAAFRPTPVGLLAGVTTAVIGDRTRIRTTGATPAVVPSWGRLYALARALLDDPSVRVGVKLRLCPSLLRGTDELCWLQLGEEETTVASAAIDEPLLQLLACLADGAQPWSDVRRALSSIFAGVDDETAASDSDIDRDAHEADVDVDDWLLLLIDQGLLTTDLVPPLVGPAPADAFVSRLRALAADAPDRATGTRLASLQVDFAAAVASARAGDVMNARVRLAA